MKVKSNLAPITLCAIGFFAMVGALPCFAQSLSALLDLARNSEPTYLSARTNVEAAKARTDQAFGALLPQISASANTNINDREYHTRIENVPTATDRYNSNSAQFTLTQPLWRYASIAGLQQAEAAAFPRRRMHGPSTIKPGQTRCPRNTRRRSSSRAWSSWSAPSRISMRRA